MRESVWRCARNLIYLQICIEIVSRCATYNLHGKAKDWSIPVAVPWQRLDGRFGVDADGGALSGKSHGRGGFPFIQRDQRGARISGNGLQRQHLDRCPGNADQTIQEGAGGPVGQDHSRHFESRRRFQQFHSLPLGA